MNEFLLEQESVGTIAFDPRSLKIRHFNQSAVAMLGQKRKIRKGQSFPQLFSLPVSLRNKLRASRPPVQHLGEIAEEIIFLSETEPLMCTFVYDPLQCYVLFFKIKNLMDQKNPFFLTQLRYYFENLNFFGIMIDARGKIRFASQSFCNYFGYSLDALIDQDFFEILLDPKNAHFVRAQAMQLFEQRLMPQTIQLKIRTGNGEFVDTLWNLKFILNGKKNVIGLSAIGIDLPSLDLRSQERMRIRGNLESIIARVASMFAQTPSYKVDETINHALEIVGEYAGVDRSYVFRFRQNLQIMDNTHEWCRRGIEPQIDNLQDVPSKIVPWWMKRLLKHEIIHIPKVNELPPEASSEKEILQAQDIISLIVVPMVDNDELVGFIGFDSVRAPKYWSEEDINLLKIVSSIFVSSLKRKATELSLADSERKYRTLFNTAPDLIFILNDKGKITSLNPAFKKITNQEIEKWLGKPFKKLILESADAFEERFRQCLNGQIPTPFEAKLHTPQGPRIVEIICAPLIERGLHKGIYGIARDITERRVLEENLRHAERMKSIGVLAGGIAHDFNNILGVLLGNYAILKEMSGKYPELQTPLHDIKQAIERGKNLVQNLLTFARKKEPNFQVLNLNEEIKHITTLLRQTTPKTIYFDLKLSETPLFIYSDRTQIHQIIFNLCLNAIDAIQEKQGHGTITITTSLESKKSAEGMCIHMAVQDDGIGMDEQQKRFVFDPFYTTKETGTGLGLAVVFGALKKMEGHIEVNSTPQQGTTFHLYFPAVEVQQPSPLSESQAREVLLPDKPVRLFLVEDDVLLSQMLVYILKRKQLDVVQAINGIQAIEVYDRYASEIEIVVLDFDLPGRDGFEVAKHIRDVNSHIPILLTSGYLEPELKESIAKLGNIYFLEKPYDPEELLDRILTLVNAI